ncbi:MAG: hypothetical protein NW205_04575 [Hyphomicrobiaceae bacterium]|nr:hypothetical protein [Hyphomicrobiaceae bacterium]
MHQTQVRDVVGKHAAMRQIEEIVRSGIIVAMGLAVFGSGLVVLVYG